MGDAVGNFELRGKYGFSLKGYFKGKKIAVYFFVLSLFCWFFLSL